MAKVEFKESFFSPITYVSIGGISTILLITIFMIWLKLLTLPSDIQAELAAVYFFSSVMTLMLLSGLIFIIYERLRMRKITIDNNHVAFTETPIFHPARIHNIAINKVVMIDYKTKTTFLPTGKTIIPVTLHYFIFKYNDNTSHTISLQGWNTNGALKNFLQYIRDEYKDIKIHTHILQDSPEKLSGIDTELKKLSKEE